jgi:glucosamine-6-phosphate deaminase
MDVIITSDYKEMSERAAEIVVGAIREKPGLVLGLATGSTPEGLYERIVKAHKEEGLDCSQLTTFNLDEYVDLPPDHGQSYRHFMDSHLFEHINVPRDSTNVPDGLAANLGEYCRIYEEMIKAAGGIDIQVLGIGRDGHLGFNEPGSSLESLTQVVALAPETIEDNARFFESEEDVPRFAITMGVRSILNARKCLMLASGESKAEAVKGAVEGPVTSMLTASALQMHRDAVVVVDEAAASGLERADYYKWAYEAKKDLADRL